MPRNGSGTYSLPSPENPIAVGSESSSTNMNTTLTDVGTALTNSLTANGEKTATANQPMGNFLHTGVGNASARTNYAAAGQVQDSTLIRLGTVAGTDTITAALTPVITAYVSGQMFTFIAAGSNTGATTLNINSVGAKAVVKNQSGGYGALDAGDIISGDTYVVIYDDAGTDQFVLVNPTLFSIGGTPVTADAAEINETCDGTSSGSYTATATGLTTAPTVTVYYKIRGAMVFIETRATISATSNASSLTLTGGPAAIRPAATTGEGVVQVFDNGNAEAGTIAMQAGGTIEFGRISNAGFTTSGSKGCNTFSFSYMLTV